MLEEESGSLQGRRWATGFIRGVSLRRSSWSGLVQDEKENGSLFAIALLGGDVDPEFVKKPLPAEQQEDLVKYAVAGMNRIARYFAAAGRGGPAPVHGPPMRPCDASRARSGAMNLAPADPGASTSSVAVAMVSR